MTQTTTDQETFDPTKLTESQLCACLHEMRNRGWAVIAYDTSDLAEGPMGKEDGRRYDDAIEDWLSENRQDLEDVMSDAVWQFCSGVDLDPDDD